MVDQEKLIGMVRSAQRGEEKGITAIYDTFHQEIYYYIFKIVKDEELAADLTQDAFVDIMQKIDTLREPGAFVTWSRQVAYSRCTAHFRKRKELLADEEEDGYSVFETLEEDRREFIPDAALDLVELKAAVHAMINDLPEEQRAALMMRYFEELSVEQIAQVQGTSVGTVKSRLNYGRRALRKAVEDYEQKTGVKLRCAGVVPLLLWLFAQSGKGAAETAAATTAATATAAAASTTATTASAAAATTGIAAKLVAGGVALALVAGGIAGAVMLQPKDSPAPEPERSLVWSGFGVAETPVKNRHFQLTLTEFTEDAVSGHLDVTYCYDDFYSTDFTGTGTEAEDGTVCYTLECETPVSGKTDTTAELIYDPETEQMSFENIYYYQSTMERWPLETGTVLFRDEKWQGQGSCDFCRADDHLFVMEIGEKTETVIRGKITMYADGKVEQSSGFTARGYGHEKGAYYEALLESPWAGLREPLRSFVVTYDSDTDSLTFQGTWYNAQLQREIP